MMSHYKRYLCLGPGGLNCACCGPAPGKVRKRAFRAAKRRERAAAHREIREEV